MALPKDEGQRIIEAMEKKGANKPCPRCGHDHFQLVGYSSILIGETRDDEGLMGAVNSVAVSCANCGFVSTHTLHGLGL